jgi:hypothetical protein
MQFVTVYGVTMSVPALIIAAIGLIAGLVMCLYHVNLIIPAFIMVAVFFLVAYNVNCVVVGQCEVFAWCLLIAFILLLASGGGLAFWNWKDMSPEDMVKMINPTKLKDTEPFKVARSVAAKASKAVSR